MFDCVLNTALKLQANIEFFISFIEKPAALCTL